MLFVVVCSFHDAEDQLEYMLTMNTDLDMYAKKMEEEIDVLHAKMGAMATEMKNIEMKTDTAEHYNGH